MNYTMKIRILHNVQNTSVIDKIESFKRMI